MITSTAFQRLSITVILSYISGSWGSVAKVAVTSPLQDYNQELSKIYTDILKNYDTRVRPYAGEQSVLVNVSVEFPSLVEVDENKMGLTVNLFLRQSWADPRLAYETALQSINSITLSGQKVMEIWVPDTFIGTARNSFLHQMTIPNDAVKIFRNGTVVRSMRLTVSIYCPFSYDYFPFDSQTCNLILGSHALTTEDIVYQWKNSVFKSVASTSKESDFHDNSDYFPHCKQFRLVGKILIEHEPVFTYGRVSRLHYHMLLQRSWRPYIPRFYFPMAIFGIISLFSLWIVDFNISLTINLFLIGFMNIFMAIRYLGKDMPTTNVKTALDTYFSICLFFVCSAAIVNFLNMYFEKQVRDKKKTLNAQMTLENLGVRNNSLAEEDLGMIGTAENALLYRPTTYKIRLLTKTQVVFKYIKRASQFLCKHAKWILPIIFVLADIIYFVSNKKNVVMDESLFDEEVYTL